MQKQTKPEPLGASMAKLVLVIAIIVCLGAVLGILGYALTKPKPVFTPSPKTISVIEISADKKSILNAETKEVIFTIADTQKYLKDSGYFYNPDTFQTTNAKYEGDCFVDAALSNKKDRIVFSTGCLAGDLPQAWVGVYNINWGSDPNTNCVNRNCLGIPKFKFLISGSSRDFVWSADDKTITYEADLGLSEMTETRKIDSQTGEILEKKQPEDETADWKTYRNEEYGFEITLLESWKGYSILENTWSGTTLDGSSKQYQGPQIIIRNPKWSEAQPWQDIPIMVFTKEEWSLIEAQNLNVSAAPVGPIKLGENQRYVFSLPPRWIGFTDVFGQNEAGEIVKTFKAIDFDETADWKTYRNEEYGFEFKHPDGLILGLSEINQEQKSFNFNDDLVRLFSNLKGFTSNGLKDPEVKLGFFQEKPDYPFMGNEISEDILIISIKQNKNDVINAIKGLEELTKKYNPEILLDEQIKNVNSNEVYEITEKRSDLEYVTRKYYILNNSRISVIITVLTHF